MEFITKEEVLRMRRGTTKESLIIINEVFSRVYNKAVEDAIRQTPDLMLKLFVSQQAQQKLKLDFYEKNPEFKEHRDIVQALVQKVDGENPGKDYDFILGLAEPMIRSAIAKLKALKALPTDKPKNFDSNGMGIL
jgi:hypothetical protein